MFSRAYMAELTRLAQHVADDVVAVSHIMPRAFCVAKLTRYSAVFSVPPQDREPQVVDILQVQVRNETAADVKVGDWCAIAYISTGNGAGGMYVIQGTSIFDGKSSRTLSSKTMRRITAGLDKFCSGQ